MRLFDTLKDLSNLRKLLKLFLDDLSHHQQPLAHAEQQLDPGVFQVRPQVFKAKWRMFLRSEQQRLILRSGSGLLMCVLMLMLAMTPQVFIQNSRL